MNDLERVEVLLTKLNDYILSILDQVFQEHYDDIIALVPFEYRYLITKRFMSRIVRGSRGVIKKLDPKVKAQIAVEVRRVFDMAEDDYVHSVLLGKPDPKLGKLLESMGQVHWNGI